MAALSPRLSWSQNQVRAHQALVEGNLFGLGHCVAKAQAIIDGADPLDVLRGWKVRSFYENLRLGNDSAAVTLDRHSYSVLEGEVRGDYDQRELKHLWFYEGAADVYRTLAKELDVPTPALQAITWLTWRRIKAGRLLPN